MEIKDLRPAESEPIKTVVSDLKTGDLFYDDNFPETIFMKTGLVNYLNAVAVSLKDGTTKAYNLQCTIKRADGYFSLLEIRD